MEIREGVNTDYAKQKFDICLDDGDLAILLAEHHVPPDIKLTVMQKYLLLRNEARIIILDVVVELGVMSVEQKNAELAQRTAQRDQWMSVLRPAPEQVPGFAEPDLAQP